jgi:hypothetical protein
MKNTDGWKNKLFLVGMAVVFMLFISACSPGGWGPVTAPTITSADNVTFSVETAGTFTVTATGTPSPSFALTGDLPSGVTFNDTTGVLSGTPDTGSGGIYKLTITASNGISPAATQIFTLTVLLVDPVEPWTFTATADTWLNTNPYTSKHDGGWVYSAREDVLYAIYGNSNNGRTLYRIDHIGHTYTVAATSGDIRHGSQPVIDDTGTYVYLTPSESSATLERYNTTTGELTTLATAPYNATYSHGTWKGGMLWIVLNDYHLYYYDPSYDSWHDTGENLGNMANLASSGPDSSLIYIMIAGGAFFSYDVTNGIVASLTSRPGGFYLGGNDELTWFGANVGFIYAADNYSSAPVIYDIASDTWYSLTDPHAPNSWAGHATYDSKRMRLYVTGTSNTVWYYQY